VYACTHLATSASLLLPVSNLTNLLAFAASGLAFGRFAALMALPWLAVIGIEYAAGVVDHAACPVLLVWPESRPDVGTIPPPPRCPRR
jgi:arsenical pump membrane protein